MHENAFYVSTMYRNTILLFRQPPLIIGYCLKTRETWWGKHLHKGISGKLHERLEFNHLSSMFSFAFVSCCKLAFG